MANDYRYCVGTVPRILTTGAQTVPVSDTAGTFTPKAVIVWGTVQSATGFTTIGRLFFGFSDGTNEGGYCSYRPDNITSTRHTVEWVSGGASTLASIFIGSVSPVPEESAHVQDFVDGEFKINWTTTSGVSFDIHYLVLGGDDTSCIVGHNLNPVATGARIVATDPVGQITGLVTLQLPSIASGSVTIPGIQIDHCPVIGWTDGTNQSSIDASAANAANTTNVSRLQRSDRVLSELAYDPTTLDTFLNNPPSETLSAAITSLGVDTFTLNYSVTYGLGAFSDAGFAYLAIAGPTILAGVFEQAIAPHPQNIPLAFSPGAVLVATTGAEASNTPLDHTHFSVGASDGITQANSWLGDTDGLETSIAGRGHFTDRVVTCASPTTGGAATVESVATATFAVDTLIFNWLAVNGLENKIAYLVFEGAEAPPAPPIPPISITTNAWRLHRFDVKNRPEQSA